MQPNENIFLQNLKVNGKKIFIMKKIPLIAHIQPKMTLCIYQ